MSETRNIVVVGAGFAGQGVAHYFMRHLLPMLKNDQKTIDYKVVIIDQSTHFWWHISAPRAIASTKSMPHNKTFIPIEEGFKQYGKDFDRISFHHAQPTMVDTQNRTITIKDVSKNAGATSNTPARTQTIPYHSLVIATGTMTPTPLTSFHGDHAKSMEALDDINKRLARAQSVIISGGGPVGVETAGEVGEALNGTNVSSGKPKVKVTLITGSNKLLPVLGSKYADKADKALGKVGVNVRYNAKVAKVDLNTTDEKKTYIHLDNGETLEADVYIPATGVQPNTGFLPREILNEKGYVNTDPTTLRVNDAGERVYCVGDVGSYTRGGVLALMPAVPAVGANLGKDLGLTFSNSKVANRQYKPDNDSETQVVPVGSKGGVGAFKGFGMPSFAVKQIKGKDYMLSNMKKYTWGTQFAKA